ncbi:MAG: methylenetetrahydrofolate--tRNA-(uracil(54)-C(5))-methyltransferase (FADH(2)-oxidizing) TrmFO [Anaerolineaceae bacterium]|nr:methylenetetrahydrofolate--tRNA-(uracil(54)-C(5))-methyltransferase (FADH(2)-oxidizing) TrmFO [Anaerolineaceae bacterium]
MQETIKIIGAGLAGCEAAWQAAQNGLQIELYEMRPFVKTGAHQTDQLAEMVCSNSLGSNLPDRASGLLKEELRRLGSLLLACAEQTSVPAGGGLAVDREAFSSLVTERIASHPNITLFRKEVQQIPSDGPVIIASGPLTSSSLSEDIHNWSGKDNLFFFDAIAPIIASESINMEIAFRASRYDRGEQEQGDYINAPLNKAEYDHFIECLLNAERAVLREFEAELLEGVRAGPAAFFEGCLPVEIIASRGHDSLAYGPMRPVGLRDPRTGNRPYAVLQLRQDNLAASLYNMVGFQTNLAFSSQREVFRLIPGLENAEFVRYGQMHRNTFIASPLLLQPTLQSKDQPMLFFAGQITGVEGYIGNVATGLLAGLNVSRLMMNQNLLELPKTTMLGALCQYITHANMKDFQPMKANFGIVPALENRVKGKRQRAAAYAERAIEHLEEFIQSNGLRND